MFVLEGLLRPNSLNACHAIYEMNEKAKQKLESRILIGGGKSGAMSESKNIFMVRNHFKAKKKSSRLTKLIELNVDFRDSVANKSNTEVD